MGAATAGPGWGFGAVGAIGIAVGRMVLGDVLPQVARWRRWRRAGSGTCIACLGNREIDALLDDDTP